jgi:hypothetical protein
MHVENFFIASYYRARLSPVNIFKNTIIDGP